jgi:RHS repeat-associated protein
MAYAIDEAERSSACEILVACRGKIDSDIRHPLYRFTSVNTPSGSSIEAYTYNQTGDRLSKVAPGMLTGSYTYAPGTHHLIGAGTTTRTVDARGNTTGNALASGAYVYGYNDRNRMTSLQKDGVLQATYGINALGLRVEKIVGDQTTLFDYDENSQLTSESSGNSTRDYVWLDGMPVGIVDNDGVSPSLAFVSADGLRTPRVVTNGSGTVLWQWAFAGNPFGEQLPTSGSGYSLNLRYPGQYYDAESGLNSNVNRDYEAATGRYIQSDPIGLDGGTNTYGYVDQNPFGFVDPLGLQAVCLACHNGVLPGFPGPVPMPPPAQSLPAPGAGAASDAGDGVGDATKPDTCPPDKPCPPCRSVSGTIIPVGTIGYRLDILPENVVQHGIYGSHYNLYKANQAPRNSARPCKCFWQPIGAVSVNNPVFGSIPIEEFAE